MTKEVRARTFKSGNSVALRLPKALGIPEGVEMKVREEQGRYIVEPAERPKRKIDVSKFAGKAPWLKPFTREEREFEPSPRAWDHPDWKGWGDEEQ